MTRLIALLAMLVSLAASASEPTFVEEFTFTTSQSLEMLSQELNHLYAPRQCHMEASVVVCPNPKHLRVDARSTLSVDLKHLIFWFQNGNRLTACQARDSRFVCVLDHRFYGAFEDSGDGGDDGGDYNTPIDG
jgi:hypothetical protein